MNPQSPLTSDRSVAIMICGFLSFCKGVYAMEKVKSVLFILSPAKKACFRQSISKAERMPKMHLRW